MVNFLRILLLLYGIWDAVFGVALQKGYYGYKVYDVTTETIGQRELLVQLSQQGELYDFFSLTRSLERPARVMVHPNGQPSFLQLMRANNISYDVISNDVGVALEREYRQHQELRQRSKSLREGRLPLERYHTHDEINDYLDELAQLYPQRVVVKTVGKSYEGRLMKTITITNGDGRSGKNIFLVDGGFHAREWVSPAAAVDLITNLVTRFEDYAKLLLDHDWVILPVANPDGYEYTQQSTLTRFWRKTRKPYESKGKICYGADPNRNFGFHWMEEGASSDPCSDTFGGPSPFSEPESVVVRDLIHSFAGRGAMYLTLHSYGNYLLYPWGWTSDLPETWQDLDEVAQAGADDILRATNKKYKVGSSTNVLYIAAGASDDYAFNAGFPVSVTMELSGGGFGGFNPPESSIAAIVAEATAGAFAMAGKVVEKYPLSTN